MALSDLVVRQAKATGKAYTLPDIDGLSLAVTATGSKSWHFRYYWMKEPKRMSLGTYPEVSLREARALRDEARALVAKDINPRLHRKQKRAAVKLAGENTFEAIYKKWLAHRERGLKKGRQTTLSILPRVFAKDVLPLLGFLQASRADFGPAAPLIGRRPANPDGGEPGQTAGGIKPGHARHAGIDDHAHAFDGQAGLGDRCGEHYLADPSRRRRDRLILFGGVQRAIERRDPHIGSAHPLGQHLGGAADLSLPRQEDQDAAGFLGQGALDRANSAIFQPQPVVAPKVSGLDGEGPALALDHRRVAEQSGDRGAVQGGRHDQDTQIIAQHPLGVARQRQPKVGVQTTFVELVEDHRPDAFQAGVAQDHPIEDALGDHLDSGPSRDFRLHADPVADGFADFLAQGLGHAVGGGAGGQAARLEHDDLTAREPGRVQQPKRYERGLPCPRRGDENRLGAGGQRRLQRRQNILNGKHAVI